MTFPNWLEQKYIEWMATEKRRRTLTAFAEWLDVSQPLISRYMAGQVMPNEENVHKIAARLGPEVYDLLGLARPDPLIQYITRNWDKLPPEEQEYIREKVERYASESAPKPNPAQPRP